MVRKKNLKLFEKGSKTYNKSKIKHLNHIEINYFMYKKIRYDFCYQVL
jgi:hypothetical protein